MQADGVQLEIIIGIAEIAGFAAALALRRAGHKVKVSQTSPVSIRLLRMVCSSSRRPRSAVILGSGFPCSQRHKVLSMLGIESICCKRRIGKHSYNVPGLVGFNFSQAKAVPCYSV